MKISRSQCRLYFLKRYFDPIKIVLLLYIYRVRTVIQYYHKQGIFHFIIGQNQHGIKTSQVNNASFFSLSPIFRAQWMLGGWNICRTKYEHKYNEQLLKTYAWHDLTLMNIQLWCPSASLWDKCVCTLRLYEFVGVLSNNRQEKYGELILQWMYLFSSNLIKTCLVKTIATLSKYLMKHCFFVNPKLVQNNIYKRKRDKKWNYSKRLIHNSFFLFFNSDWENS